MRERLAFAEPLLPEALESLVGHNALDEALIVSTCNRVELIASTPMGSDQGLDSLADFLSQYHKLPSGSLNGHIYKHADGNAIKHLFRVAASLDSMVIGESRSSVRSRKLTNTQSTQERSGACSAS